MEVNGMGGLNVMDYLGKEAIKVKSSEE